jgi:TonB family protein
MKCLSARLTACVFIIFASINSLADSVKVIANVNVRTDTISVADLKRVFLREKTSLADGTHVEPVLEEDGPVHEAFLREYLGMNKSDLEMYYRTLLFTGKGSMPKKLGTDIDMVEYVARTRGAIGYVSSKAIVEGVRIVGIDVPIGPERKLITRVEPDYPEPLLRLHIGGTVRLRISISPKGNVENVDLLGGNPILGESASAAVSRWVYAAGRSRSVSEISISFGDH